VKQKTTLLEQSGSTVKNRRTGSVSAEPVFYFSYVEEVESIGKTLVRQLDF